MILHSYVILEKLPKCMAYKCPVKAASLKKMHIFSSGMYDSFFRKYYFCCCYSWASHHLLSVFLPFLTLVTKDRIPINAAFPCHKMLQC